MRTVLQRVREAEVRVEGATIGRISEGLLLLVGVERGDDEADVDATVRKIVALRCFAGRTPMDKTVGEVGGACLVVSQFTLAASLRKGNRPGFDRAEDPARAQALYERVVEQLRQAGLSVETGRFGAAMQVSLVNDGPVTLVVETEGGRIVDRLRARPQT